MLNEVNDYASVSSHLVEDIGRVTRTYKNHEFQFHWDKFRNWLSQIISHFSTQSLCERKSIYSSLEMQT